MSPVGVLVQMNLSLVRGLNLGVRQAGDVTAGVTLSSLCDHRQLVECLYASVCPSIKWEQMLSPQCSYDDSAATEKVTDNCSFSFTSSQPVPLISFLPSFGLQVFISITLCQTLCQMNFKI